MPDENDIIFENYGFDPITPLLESIFGMDGAAGASTVWQLLQTLWSIWSVIAFILSFIFIFGIIYAYIRYNQLSEIENQRLLDAERLWQQRYGATDNGIGQWQLVKAHLESDNPNDWKLAIIEADIMLERVLKDAGYAGNSVGEMLKSASPTNFTTLQDAWDAHIIRNKIAHEGSDFVVTHRIAKEAITKFQRVFHEFGVM